MKSRQKHFMGAVVTHRRGSKKCERAYGQNYYAGKSPAHRFAESKQGCFFLYGWSCYHYQDTNFSIPSFTCGGYGFRETATKMVPFGLFAVLPYPETQFTSLHKICWEIHNNQCIEPKLLLDIVKWCIWHVSKLQHSNPCSFPKLDLLQGVQFIPVSIVLEKRRTEKLI